MAANHFADAAGGLSHLNSTPPTAEALGGNANTPLKYQLALTRCWHHGGVLCVCRRVQVPWFTSITLQLVKRVLGRPPDPLLVLRPGLLDLLKVVEALRLISDAGDTIPLWRGAGTAWGLRVVKEAFSRDAPFVSECGVPHAVAPFRKRGATCPPCERVSFDSITPTCPGAN